MAGTDNTHSKIYHLKIPVNNSLLVEVAQSRNNFRSVKPRPVFRKDSFARKMEEQFTAIDVFHYET